MKEFRVRWQKYPFAHTVDKQNVFLMESQPISAGDDCILGPTIWLGLYDLRSAEEKARELVAWGWAL